MPLLPDRGYLILDVVHGRIMFVEVLDRPELRPPLTAALTAALTAPVAVPVTAPVDAALTGGDGAR